MADWESLPERDARALLSLISKTRDHPVVVAFYGGEPLLATEKIEAIRQSLRRALNGRPPLRFMLYTNGELISRTLKRFPELFRDLWLCSVSIDGSEKQHNRFRQGTDLRRIKENLRALKDFGGPRVLMWSTLREEASLRDCLEEFLRLKEAGLVDCFFWHLIETDHPIEDFEAFLKAYTEDLYFLFETYISWLKEGRGLPVLPLNELFFMLLSGIRRGHTGCGVELLSNFDLQAGKVLPCADLGEDFVLGRISPSGEVHFEGHQVSRKLETLVGYRDELGCPGCPADFYCGGRCPVLIKNSPERARQYCVLTRTLVALAREYLPPLKNLLSPQRLSPEDLYFPYGYLALFTDVVP